MNDWITIPEEFVKDKPLPEGYFWNLKESDEKFASIRVGSLADFSNARRRASIRRGSSGMLAVEAKVGSDWDVISTFVDTRNGLKEAVNFMYAHFILGEQST